MKYCLLALLLSTSLVCGADPAVDVSGESGEYRQLSCQSIHESQGQGSGTTISLIFS
jgi:hypothetical protein